MDLYWEDTREFLAKTGWKTKAMGGNFMVEHCPYCNDKRWKFGIAADRPVWKCHHCEETGNLKQLADTIGMATGHIVEPMKKTYVKPEGVSETILALRKFPTVIQHLKNRGFDGELAKRFNLGAEHKHGKDWLVIPHYFRGEVVNCKYRSVTGDKEYRRSKGGRTVLFNSNAINDKELLITEGEFDCMTISQAYGDSYPVVGSTGGAKHFDPEWIDYLGKTKKIYLCYDRDEAGQAGAKDVARRLGYDRCFNIMIPEGFNDISDFYTHEPQDFIERFDKLKAQARRYEIQSILSAGALLEKVFSTREVEQNTTPWKPLNRMLDVRPGHLVIVTADPGAGKTSLVLEWLRHRVNLFREPVLFYCLDMRPDDLTMKIMQLQFDVSQSELLTRRDEFLDKGKAYFGEFPRWYLCGKWWDKKEDYFKLIRAAVKRYGFKYVCFDHFHKLIESLGNTVQEQSNLATQFKRLADETETTIVLIAQPKKRSGGITTADDISGSGILRAEADSIITLTRKRVQMDEDGITESSFEPEGFVRVDKARSSAGGGCKLNFYGPTQKFTTPEQDDIISPEEEEEDDKHPFS